MATYNTLQEALVGYLRGQAIPGITWGDHDSPAYEEFPEPTRFTTSPTTPFPYVGFFVDESSVDHSLASGDSPDYTESYRVTFHVISYQATIAALSSPYVSGSVGYVLDGLTRNPLLLNGVNFSVIGWCRTGWSLKKLETRGPDQQRVYDATLVYEAILEATYPPLPS